MEKVNLITAIIVTAVANVIFIVLNILFGVHFAKAMTMSALATVFSFGLSYGKYKLGLYSDKEENLVYAIYIIQIVIALAIIVLVNIFTR